MNHKQLETLTPAPSENSTNIENSVNSIGIANKDEKEKEDANSVPEAIEMFKVDSDSKSGSDIETDGENAVSQR